MTDDCKTVKYYTCIVKLLNFITHYYLLNQMGSSKSSPIEQKPEDTQIPKINHQKFTNYQLIGKPQEELIQIIITVPSQQQYLDWKQQLAKLQDQEPLLTPQTHKFQKQGFCSTAGIIQITYEYFPFLLRDQIDNRRTSQPKYFQENELWYLTYTLLTAANLFHRRGKKIGDVRPANIFISEDGSVKTACVYSWPKQKTNYEKIIDKQITYLAPQELSDLGYGRIEPASDLQLAETFSIGLSVLDAATLHNSRQLYKTPHSFDYQGLATTLESLNQKQYSKVFKLLIANMCETNAQKRTKAAALYQWLQPYDHAINNFEKFAPQILPQKFAPKNKEVPAPPQNPVNPKYNGFQSTTTNLVYKQPNIVFQPSPPTLTKVPYPSVNFTKITPAQYPKGNDFHVSSPFTSTGLSNPIGNTQPALFPLPQLVTAQSTYVPYNSKFYLDKIDNQLQQSRKLYPPSS